MSSPSEARRYIGLDAIRAGAMMLGLFYHGLYAYIPGIEPWYPIVDGAQNDGFTIASAFLHGFRMEVFFALSGFFAHLLINRRGADAFLVDRARRLLVPMLVALPYAIFGVLAVTSVGRRLGVTDVRYVGPGQPFSPTYLWFLEYLFLFCAAAWAFARVALRRPHVRESRWMFLWLLPCVVGTVVLADRFPELAPWNSFLPQAPALLHFGTFFAAGFVLHATGVPRLGPAWVGLLLLAAGLALTGYGSGIPMQWTSEGRAIACAGAWLIVVGALDIGCRAHGEVPPKLRYLVDASYWVYLTHYPLVLALQLALVSVSLPALAKYLLCIGATTAVTLATYDRFVHSSPIAEWIGARRSRMAPTQSHSSIHAANHGHS